MLRQRNSVFINMEYTRNLCLAYLLPKQFSYIIIQVAWYCRTFILDTFTAKCSFRYLRKKKILKKDLICVYYLCCNNIAWNWDHLKGWTREESNCCRITKHIEPFCTHTSTDSTSSQITMYMQLLNSFHGNYKLIYKRTWSLYLLTMCFITCRWIFLGTKIFSFLLFYYVNERIDNKTKSHKYPFIYQGKKSVFRHYAVYKTRMW